MILEDQVEIWISQVAIQLLDLQISGRVRVATISPHPKEVFLWFLQRIQVVILDVSPVQFVTNLILYYVFGLGLEVADRYFLLLSEKLAKSLFQIALCFIKFVDGALLGVLLFFKVHLLEVIGEIESVLLGAGLGVGLFN